MGRKATDEIGKRYGKLLVIERYGTAPNGFVTWRCGCDCGNETIVRGSFLRVANTRSCGCLRGSKKTHGFSDHPVYEVWLSMKARCYNPKHTQYKYWGGRGIYVCEQWKNDAGAFCEWALSNGWKQGLTIDRIENDGHYEPSNCRFVTKAEQNRNTRLLYAHNTSGYRGVSYHKRVQKYHAQICVAGRNRSIGYFGTSLEAALVWDEFAKHLNDGRPLNFGEVP